MGNVYENKKKKTIEDLEVTDPFITNFKKSNELEKEENEPQLSSNFVKKFEVNTTSSHTEGYYLPDDIITGVNKLVEKIKEANPKIKVNKSTIAEKFLREGLKKAGIL